jgi:drug/metabolite transporter (DMT)-like permease
MVTDLRAAGAVVRRLDGRVLLAFAAIYFLWGATFLAIRVAVQEVPPFFSSGLRFFVAGALLYAFMRLRGQPRPTAIEWRGVAIIALCMFVATYGALFWAEQYVPSGSTAVIEATLPLITLTLEVFVFRRQTFSWRMAGALALGFCGVAWLLIRNEQQTFPPLPCLVILAGGVAWSLGAVLTRSMPHPKSIALAAGAQMMLGGAVLLALSLATGEVHGIPRISLHAGLALSYLITGGSLVGFTAYVWLLARMPATRVSSHAYVNPLVALALGHFVGGEVLTLEMILASALVVTSVFLILTAPDELTEVRSAARTSAWQGLRGRAELNDRGNAAEGDVAGFDGGAELQGELRDPGAIRTALGFSCGQPSPRATRARCASASNRGPHPCLTWTGCRCSMPTRLGDAEAETADARR